jgi:TRAP-type mannitol/chloroaromatic compound transport system permease small subunit
MAEGIGREPVIDHLARRTGELFSYVFLASMVIIAYEVVMRYGFNAPTVWAHDTTTALSAVGFLISGIYTLQRRAHIRITFVYERLSAGARRWLDMINGAIVLLFLGLLGYQSSLDAWKSILIMETAGTASRLPIPPIVKSALALACAGMFVLAATHLARTARRRG